MKRGPLRKFFPFFGLILMLVTLPFLLRLIKQITFYIGEASGQKANIIVDVSVDQGPLVPIWQALAQGGEEKNPFDSIANEMAVLKPKYVRIDHLYDLYDTVKKENGQLIFNWTELDKVVNQILASGAKPFLSLSYMPPAIAQNGDITAPPVDWNDWSTVVRETIQHYSGRQNRNLENVAYEVWNEPDLFGNWRVGGKKDYRVLYQYAVIGANQVRNTNSFKIGGPSTTAPYENWVDGFLNYTVRNNLRIDFYSWHRYYLKPEKFLEDVDKIDTWLFQNAGYALPKFLTEWGSVSENSSYHDSNFDGSHLVATVRQLIQRVDLAFVFEIKDGPPPTDKKYWGRWGLLTHEKAGTIEKKPKYYALQLLNRMTGNRVGLDGEGTWVTGFAVKEGKKIKIILANLDQTGQHFETVPLTINNIPNGAYSYRETFLLGPWQTSNEDVVGNTLKKEIFLLPNNVVVVELTKT